MNSPQGLDKVYAHAPARAQPDDRHLYVALRGRDATQGYMDRCATPRARPPTIEAVELSVSGLCRVRVRNDDSLWSIRVVSLCLVGESGPISTAPLDLVVPPRSTAEAQVDLGRVEPGTYHIYLFTDRGGVASCRVEAREG